MTAIERPHRRETAGDVPDPPEAKLPTRNDDLLYVGLSDGAAYEAAQLKAVHGAHVQTLLPTRQEVTVDGRTFDLGKREGIDAYVAGFGLAPDTSRAIADVLASCAPDERGEVGLLARAWAPAERGERIPGRLVLSGHHGEAGNQIYGAPWGADQGWTTLRFDRIEALAKAMPHAARAIDDVFLSACNTETDAGKATIEPLRRAFPTARTITGYDAKCPTKAGAVLQLEAWERVTRGTADPKTVPALSMLIIEHPARHHRS